MKTEADLWAWLELAMRGYWEADRIEAVVPTEGCPDVTYSAQYRAGRDIANRQYGGLYRATGWIELKYVAREPRSIEHILKIPHYTPDQRNFLHRHGRMAGCTWLFVGVGNILYIFDWKAAQEVGKLRYRDFMDSSCLFLSLVGSPQDVGPLIATRLCTPVGR